MTATIGTLCACGCGRAVDRAGSRGLHNTCYKRLGRHQALDAYPRRTRSRADVLDSWAEMSVVGFTVTEVAGHLGMSCRALLLALQRAGERGA